MKSDSDPALVFSSDIFAARRKRVLANLDGSALVLDSTTNVPVRRYGADSELSYLTGVTEPGAVAVLRPGSEAGDFVLFLRPRDSEAARWRGARLGPDRAKAAS